MGDFIFAGGIILIAVGTVLFAVSEWYLSRRKRRIRETVYQIYE